MNFFEYIFEKKIPEWGLKAGVILTPVFLIWIVYQLLV